MTKELAKGYEAREIEEKWLAYWKENNTFSPDMTAGGESYSIVIPPPNVTGTLHIGHALNLTLQDILCRFKRQQGFKVLWVPGTDHAGIATQNVVEKALAEQGLTRDDLGREKFIERVWEWKHEYGDKILNQIRKMGASVDWGRLRFTMDEGLSRAVREVFVTLYEQGLIYQGNYIINWCPRCQTALADLEVEHELITGGLYQIRYPLSSGQGEVVVATTRPETMLGDSAVAVHPDDERYQDLIGQKVLLPLLDREIPIIADDYVDRAFGTGCLKVTPAHDPNDFVLGKNHGLSEIQVIDEQGKMTEAAGPQYAGLDRFVCRKKLVNDLREQGYLLDQQEYEHSVGHCYRCKSIIEPTISKQWFVATKTLAQKAKQAVEQGRTKFYPAQWTKTYFKWLEEIKDWCVSRQIWWGHRIPVWFCQDCGEVLVRRKAPDRCSKCAGQNLRQDEDVLDTWFSSALWPFSTLGWPEQTKDLEVFYPTSVLVTGFDIIFFWVARMMMMGLHFMDEVPFKDVYIHALVRDETGRKMSKSVGNVIDPLLMIDKYGADALRFTLTSFAAMGRDIKLSEARIEGYKHFMNKIWNAARFVLMNLDPQVKGLSGAEIADLAFCHRYILHALEGLKADVTRSLDRYYFNEAAQALYQFVWHVYCDWYLEMVKLELGTGNEKRGSQAQAVLWQTLSEILVLLHPFVPFITQEIWEKLPNVSEVDLSRIAFPATRDYCLNMDLEAEMALLQEVVVSVRNIRSELNINPGQQLKLLIKAQAKEMEVLERHKELIIHLARLQSMDVSSELQAPEAAASAVVSGCELFVPLQGVVDFKQELARIEKQLLKVVKAGSGLKKKLANENFLSKAPAEVVAKEREKLAELEEKEKKLNQLKGRLAVFVN